MSNDRCAELVDHLRMRPYRMEDLEFAAIKAALIRTNYCVTDACLLLGIGRTTLYRKMEKYQLKREAA